MAKSVTINHAMFSRSGFKGTSIGNGKRKSSSLNKHKRRATKRYRGQGK